MAEPEMAKPESTFTCWPHAPVHWFVPKANYFVTAGTYLKRRHFNTTEKLDVLQSELFEQAGIFGWSLQAWAFMANHYHLVMQAPENAKTLESMMRAVHSNTARWLNEVDNSPGREVWYNYRDTCLTYRNSYFARLNYTNQNPVKHKLVQHAAQYRWCSKAWFNQSATPAFRKTIESFPIDNLKVWDDFD